MSPEELATEVDRMKARLTELMTGKFGECRILTVKGKCFLSSLQSSPTLSFAQSASSSPISCFFTISGRLSDELRELVKTPTTEAEKRAKEE